MATLITDTVRQLVRMRGPVIPVQIAKEIGTNILMASAILSELSGKNDIKISTIKVGGSPLYYATGQEAKLQNYLGGLHPKEKEAFEKLKAAGVIEDTKEEPAIRVALRELKDFAKPLDATIDGEARLFWKWYLLSSEEAELSIKKLVGIEEKPAPAEASHEIKQMQATLTPEAKPKKIRTPKAVSAEFSKSITAFFAQNGIEVLSEIPESQECVVELPSPVGKLKYYCVAKDKKTCTDSDISLALVQGQLKRLPVLLLTTGELTKKAQELLTKEIGAIVIKKI